LNIVYAAIILNPVGRGAVFNEVALVTNLPGLEYLEGFSAEIFETINRTAKIPNTYYFRTFASLKKVVYVIADDNKAKIYRIPDQHTDQLHLYELVRAFG